jgi:thioredoxin:protein disulfide reductase
LAVLSMSMFGVYELQLPAALRDRLDARAHRMQGGQWAGVFAMGGLSALIVSPCVAAPLAGALLYISHSRDVVLGGSALFSLAAGMSVPLLLVGASAGALLPKAGAWMDSVKRFFGVLLLGVAWYVLSPVLGAELVVAGWGMLALGAATVLGAFGRRGGAARAPTSTGAGPMKVVGWVFAALGAAQLAGAAAGATNPLQPLRPFTQARTAVNRTAAADQLLRFQPVRDVAELDAAIRAANDAGKTVMLDFYADWCVSCKEMEHLTFTDPRVVKHSDADRALLKRFDLFGPPGILFFDVQGRESASQRVIGFQNAEVFLASLQRAGLR